MKKKDLILGIANGIVIFLIARLAYAIDPLGFVTNVMPFIILIAEFIVLKAKKEKMGILFYAASLIVSAALLALTYLWTLQY